MKENRKNTKNEVITLRTTKDVKDLIIKRSKENRCNLTQYILSCSLNDNTTNQRTVEETVTVMDSLEVLRKRLLHDNEAIEQLNYISQQMLKGVQDYGNN